MNLNRRKFTVGLAALVGGSIVGGVAGGDVFKSTKLDFKLPEALIPSLQDILKVTDNHYIIKSTNKNITNTIQKAIYEVSKSTKGIVALEPGIYNLDDSLTLPGNVVLTTNSINQKAVLYNTVSYDDVVINIEGNNNVLHSLVLRTKFPSEDHINIEHSADNYMIANITKDNAETYPVVERNSTRYGTAGLVYISPNNHYTYFGYNWPKMNYGINTFDVTSFGDDTKQLLKINTDVKQ
jgi:hypothetical protein